MTGNSEQFFHRWRVKQQKDTENNKDGDYVSNEEAFEDNEGEKDSCNFWEALTFTGHIKRNQREPARN